MTALILWLLLASHGLFLVVTLARARYGDRPVADQSVESILSLLAAYTALLWGPVVLARVLLAVFVLDPLRLSIEWGADHTDSQTNSEKFTKGRTLRRLVPWFPWLSVGTYTRATWVRDVDRAGTVTNQIVEIGFRHLGVCVIRLGQPVADPERAPGPQTDDPDEGAA